MASKRVSDRQFAESKHRYTDPRTGERVTSVTAIVGSLDTGDKLGAGAGAAVKLTKEGKNYRQVWNDKAALGTRVHGYAQLWMEGKSADVPESEMPYMDAFAQYYEDHKPTWLEVERAVVHSAGYGGRFDMFGEDGVDHLYDMLDIKTGKPYKAELTLQLAGYRFADGMIQYDEAGMAADLEPMPHIDRAGGLYLHDDGTYTLQYVDATEEAFDVFLKLLAVKTWAAAANK